MLGLKFVNQEEDFVGLMMNLQVHSGSNMAMSTTSDSHTLLHARAAVERLMYVRINKTAQGLTLIFPRDGEHEN
jgi:hypothetical protein